jgi:hypothetical protein
MVTQTEIKPVKASHEQAIKTIPIQALYGIMHL